MTRQTFYIDKWKVIVYWNIDYDFFNSIAHDMSILGASYKTIKDTYNTMLHGGKAFTYNSKEKHTSILGFNKHADTSDLLNSIVHEAEHIKQAIMQEYNITDNETPAYLLGYIVMKMWEGRRNV